jgi:ribosomal protein S8
MIITDEIRLLVHQIESQKEIKPYLKLLLQNLHSNCLYHLKNDREQYVKLPALETPYPIENGYAIAFDPLIQENEILQHWYQYGFVVGKNVVTNKECENVLKVIENIVSITNMDFSDSNTWKKDSNETKILSRGFFEIYHDDALAQIRQNIRIYLYHVILWGSPFLWTSFDRLGIKLPYGKESQGLSLHVDQNPNVHPDFRTMQGVLALVDCPEDRGTFVAVPGSKKYFEEYKNFVKEGYKGEYVQLDESSDFYIKLKANQQCIPLQKGHIVSWDSRTTHANSSNVSNLNRYVMYIATGLAKDDNEEIINIRKDLFYSGLGNNVRDAYSHASKKPRFTDPDFIMKTRKLENLTNLGKCLYGLKKYSEIIEDIK